MKSPTPLNIPKNEDRFGSVSFVNDMNELQLKVFIKRLFDNLKTLANQMEGRRTDVSKVLDMIMDGKRWTNKDLDDRFIYGYYSSQYIIRFDSLKKQFSILDKDFQQVENTIHGITRTDNRKAKEKEKPNVI